MFCLRVLGPASAMKADGSMGGDAWDGEDVVGRGMYGFRSSCSRLAGAIRRGLVEGPRSWDGTVRGREHRESRGIEEGKDWRTRLLGWLGRCSCARVDREGRYRWPYSVISLSRNKWTPLPLPQQCLGGEQGVPVSRPVLVKARRLRCQRIPGPSVGCVVSRETSPASRPMLQRVSSLTGQRMHDPSGGRAVSRETPSVPARCFT